MGSPSISHEYSRRMHILRAAKRSARFRKRLQCSAMFLIGSFADTQSRDEVLQRKAPEVLTTPGTSFLGSGGALRHSL